MKQYIIDEIRDKDYNKIKSFCDNNLEPSKIEGIYHIVLSSPLLNKTQKSHKECQPFYFAIHLLRDKLIIELLIRTKKKLKCDCIGYANKTQRNWIIDYFDGVLKQLGIVI